MAVAVVTDTTHYLPESVVDALELHLVSLYVAWPGQAPVREADLGDLDAFYAEMLRRDDLPRTSQPSIGDFLAVYEPLLARGDDIVSVHLASALSGTLTAAEQARATLVERGIAPERIVVIDSIGIAAGHGVVAMAAAAAAQRGASLGEAVEAARRSRADIEVRFAVDTLDFLRRGGRIGAASAYLGTALKIKPILSFEAEVRPIARVRTSGRAFDHLVAHLELRHADGCDGFMVQHAFAGERAERLVERGREIFGREPEIISQVGAVIAAHVGPGLLGAAGVRRHLLQGRTADEASAAAPAGCV